MYLPVRARKITNCGQARKVIGKFPSLKMHRTIWWESQIERDYIYLLEFDHEVLSYREQPLRIRYVRDGKEHHYTPDFLVEYADVKHLIEVKPAREVAKEANQSLFRAVAPQCRQADYRFTVVTDEMIRVQPRLDTIKLLWRYARTPLTLQHHLICRQFMCQSRHASFGDLIRDFAERGIPSSVIYALLYHGVLTIDLMQPLNSDTVVTLLDAHAVDEIAS